jgi:hypothetical protein
MPMSDVQLCNIDGVSYWWSFGRGGEYSVSPEFALSPEEIPYGRVWVSVPHLNYRTMSRIVCSFTDTDDFKYILKCFRVDVEDYPESDFNITFNKIIVKPHENPNTYVRQFNLSTNVVWLSVVRKNESLP